MFVIHIVKQTNFSLYQELPSKTMGMPCSERWKGSNMCADWLAKNCLSMELGESNVCGLASEDLSVHGA